MRNVLLFGLAVLVLACTATGQAAMLNPGGYSTDFTGLGGTMPDGWSIWTVPTDHATFTTGVPITATAVGGATLTGNSNLITWNQGDAGAKNQFQGWNMGAGTDRSLGTSPTTVGALALELALQNNTGAALSSVTVGYQMRMWLDQGVTEQLPGYAFFYKDGTTWQESTALKLTAAGSASATIDLTNPVANGGVIYLRWADDNNTGGNDQMIAVDNVSVAPVPEPSTLVLLGMGAIGLLAYAWRRRSKA